MKVFFKYIGKVLDFDDNNIKLFVLENNIAFRETINCLRNDNEEGLFVFSKNYEEIDFKKNVRFISDILGFSVNDKKMLNKLYKDIEVLINTQYFTEITHIRQHCYELCEKIVSEYDYDLDFCAENDTMSFIKLFSFMLLDNEENVAEKILNYFMLMNKYLGVHFFVTQNMYMYFSKEEIDNLLDSVKLFGYNLIDIENSVPRNISGKEELTVVDADLCTIT